VHVCTDSPLGLHKHLFFSQQPLGIISLFAEFTHERMCVR